MTAPRPRKSSELTPLLAIVPSILPKQNRRSHRDELDRLEHELSALLQWQAPTTWREQRRVLWRLTRAARREIRRRQNPQ
jgi:hypothetical protein